MALALLFGWSAVAGDSVVAAGAVLRSPNLLRNTSFRQCTARKAPDYWGCGHYSGTVSGVWWKGEYFRVVDEPSPVPGTKVLRTRAGTPTWAAWHTLQCWRKYTFSAYMRSDVDAYPVELVMGDMSKHNPSKVVQVGREWQRYSVTGKPVKGCWFGSHWDILTPGIKPRLARGKPKVEAPTLWIAAPQLEFGDAATPYQPADADVFTPSKIDQQVRFPVVQSTKVERPPTLQEFLAEDTSRGTLVDAADAGPVPAGYETTFGVYHDEHHLYVLARCGDPEIASMPEPRRGGPEYRLLYEDSLWLYLKSDFGGNDYFVFGSGATGKRCDIAWYWFDGWNNSSWTAVTAKGSDYWAVKFAVPFYTIPQITGENAIHAPLGLNLRRIRRTHDGSDNGLARDMWFWSPDRGTRLPCAFGKLEGIDVRRTRVCRIADGRLAFVGLDQVDALLHIDYVPNLAESGSLSVEVCAPTGETVSRVVPFRLDGRARAVRVEGLHRGRQPGTYHLRTKVMDESAHTIGEYTQRIYVPDSLRMLDNGLIATADRSYYTSERRARLMVQSNVDKSLTFTVALDAPEATTLITDAVELPARGRRVVAFDLAEVPLGKHRMVVTARSAGAPKVVGRAYETIEKLPPPPAGHAEVKVDRFRRILLRDGRPIIPWADRESPERFNTLFRDTVAAKRLGMMCIPWGGGWNRDYDVKKWARSALTSGADVIAYMFHDEPSARAASMIQRQYRDTKSIDPYKPAYFLTGEWPFDAQRWAISGIPDATDIVASSCYPWGCCGSSLYTLGQRRFYDLQQAQFHIRNMGRLIRKHGLTGWLNFATYSAGESVHIGSSKHHRCLVYLGLVHGIRGFSEWGGRAVSDETWDSFIEIKRQLETLAPILGGPSALEEDYGQRNGMHYALWTGDGRSYLIVCNPWPEPRTFEYDLSDLEVAPAKSVRTLFEGDRAPQLEGGILTAKLGAYDSAVCECTGN